MLLGIITVTGTDANSSPPTPHRAWIAVSEPVLGVALVPLTLKVITPVVVLLTRSVIVARGEEAMTKSISAAHSCGTTVAVTSRAIVELATGIVKPVITTFPGLKVTVTPEGTFVQHPITLEPELPLDPEDPLDPDGPLEPLDPELPLEPDDPLEPEPLEPEPLEPEPLEPEPLEPLGPPEEPELPLELEDELELLEEELELLLLEDEEDVVDDQDELVGMAIFLENVSSLVLLMQIADCGCEHHDISRRKKITENEFSHSRNRSIIIDVPLCIRTVN